MIALDSSFLIAFFNEGDAHHPRAVPVMERLLDGEWGAGILLDYVFAEVTTVLMARRDLATARRVGDLLLHSREIDLVPGWAVFEGGFEVFREQEAGALGFTDAAIVAVARERAAGFVATFDSDFREIAGLTVVPDEG